MDELAREGGDGSKGWKRTGARWAFVAIAIACLTPYMPSALALLLGVLLAVTLGNPFSDTTRTATTRLLSASVIGLGAGMDLRLVASVGAAGIGYTLAGIGSALAIGYGLGRWLKTDRETSLLLSVGTAICGGSAIAAVAPAIRARPAAVSVALGTVFLLNAVALVIFPWIGHSLALDESSFGLWSALAIHDTSSVVGATLAYGPHALAVGTTVKLARALWIVPVTFAIGLAWKKDTDARVGTSVSRPKRPWFILGFLALAAIVTFVPETRAAGHAVELVARRALVLTLFLIGSNLSRETIRSVGVRPLLQGVILWIWTAGASLAAILLGWAKV